MSTEPVHPEAVERERLARMCEEEAHRASVSEYAAFMGTAAADFRTIAAILRSPRGAGEERTFMESYLAAEAAEYGPAVVRPTSSVEDAP